MDSCLRRNDTGNLDAVALGKQGGRLTAGGVFLIIDASVKSISPPRFWSVGVVFAAFFRLLTVASLLWKNRENSDIWFFLPIFT